MNVCKLDKKFESLASRVFKLNLMGTVSISCGPNNNNWKYLDVLVWESEYGPIPFGHVVVHKDGDLLNCKLENLRLHERFTKIYYNICIDHDTNYYIIHFGRKEKKMDDLSHRKGFMRFHDILERFERYNEQHDFILTRDFEEEKVPDTIIPLDPHIRCVCGKTCRSPAIKRTHDKKCNMVKKYQKNFFEFETFPNHFSVGIFSSK